MIEISKGSDVIALVDKITAASHCYSEIIICSPFIDFELFPRLVLLARKVERSRCSLRIVTTGTFGKTLLKQLEQQPVLRHTVVVIHPRLHAKVYVALARHGRRSEAIVTSANFTRGGVRGNVELGVRVLCST